LFNGAKLTFSNSLKALTGLSSRRFRVCCNVQQDSEDSNNGLLKMFHSEIIYSSHSNTRTSTLLHKTKKWMGDQSR